MAAFAHFLIFKNKPSRSKKIEPTIKKSFSAKDPSQTDCTQTSCSDDSPSQSKPDGPLLFLSLCRIVLDKILAAQKQQKFCYYDSRKTFKWKKIFF
jgi:hypothetical protein